ncbi:MAG: hypothetical protein PWR08_1687 [Thermoanaerobacterium sp.]|uniref:Uncharacterized protein n=1 Tax=Thermoanaerobacterium butyriciformans TaxID=1702242 RepID=A0ABS4NF53_9THEO|nr:hypothetical protein [Thermoanaerobacterium butyriciformans]MBP2072300.1 hypothetical protein [Thermoanaerobacterium butyriciformans]MDK2805970.1 hypothetical protein [Thermoanaerobacterium sp.]MDN5317562.1 hypothetical protein [Thermoanaerobacterium sp.]
MKKKIFSYVLLIVLISYMGLEYSFAGDAGIKTSKSYTESFLREINNDYESVLEEKGVSREKIKKLSPSILKGILFQAYANNFTDNQIQQLVEGQLSLLNENSPAKMNNSGKIRDDGLIETNYGVFLNLYANKTIKDVAENNEKYYNVSNNIKFNNSTMVQPLSYTGSYRSITNSKDQSGTYWLIKSEAGYREATAFVTLPTIDSMSTNDRAYMFFSVNTNPSSIVGDYGVVYSPNISAWVPCTNTGVWNSSTQKYDMSWWNGNSIPSNITKLYFDVVVTTTSTNDTVTITIYNGDNFSQVLGTKTITFNNNPINSTYSNINIYREITMAQINTGTLNTNTGSYFKNAIFTNSYIYSTTGYYQWGTSQTNDAYIQAPTTKQLNTITVNSYSKWYSEDITMRYNIP